MQCSSCNSEIFPGEVYYTLNIHTEQADPDDPDKEKSTILDMQTLDRRCQVCMEKDVHHC